MKCDDRQLKIKKQELQDKMKLLKKAWKAEISTKLVAIGVCLALVALLAPIARIMGYCVPWYDDFSYGKAAKIYWEMNHSFFDVLKGVLQNVKETYYAWQGTYTSCFFMSLMPACWGTDKYVYGLWFVLAVLLLGVFSLVHVLLSKLLNSRDRWANLAIEGIVACTVVVFMRSAIEGYFWYNSAVHYTAMHGFGMMFAAVLITLVYAEGKGKMIALTVFSMLFGAVMGGVNNVTVLQVGLVILSILGFGLIFRRKSVLRVIPAGIVFGIGMYMNLFSPGNAKRMVFYEGMRLSVVEAILRSLRSALGYLWDFTGWMTLAIMLFTIPVAWCLVKKTNFTFRYPGLVILWSFCLYAAGFSPTLYTMGHTLLGRATNMVKVTFQLLLFIDLIYLIGWLCVTMTEKKRLLPIRQTWRYYLLMAVLMLCIFGVEPNKGGKYSPYCAYYFVHTGEAYNYYHEYLQRVAICESPEEDVVVSPYVFKPWLLCLGDLSEAPDYEPNRFMAEYFGKNSIVCKPFAAGETGEDDL